MVEVHCRVLLCVMKLIKSSQAVWTVISGPGPERGILLLSYHLSSPLCTLGTVTGGLLGLALISVCLSFSISHCRSRESSPGPGWTGPWMDREGPMAAEQSAQCGRADVWGLADALQCVPHVTPLTLSWPNLCSPYSFISLTQPHNSIKQNALRSDHNRNFWHWHNPVH